ncbi:M24 family metallopeptidase [Roseateles chitinivorans]|uniref:NAD(P)H dependent flavin oxidoreductase family protein n=1 Tax=Roseateles chitinivorans TaxID=2917965 RepID=UPI003D67EE19
MQVLDASSDTFTLMPHGVRLPMAAHPSVLDTALAAGLSVPFSCQRGACGSCAADCLSGDVEHASTASATAIDPGPGRVLMCQVRARGDVVLRVPDWVPQAPPQRVEMCVLARRPLSPDVVELVLDPGREVATHAGQHLRIRLPDGDHRCFSIANRREDPRDPLELQIRRVPGGRFSEALLGGLMPGAVLDVEAPFGAPAMPAPDTPLVLLATGTGYAGVRALLQAALADPATPAVTLYWGGRHAADHYARAELDAWAAADGRLRWQAVSPEATKGHAGEDGALQRHVQDHALADGHDWSSVRVHACGHPGMLRDARLALQAAGLPAARWHADAFVPSGRDDAAHDWERSGPQFDLAGIVAARERSIVAVQDIAALLRPGMSGEEARLLADERLRALGSQRNWHPTIVRFGEDTTCTSREPGDPSRRLRADDIVFIDIGPVWDGYEGDYGDTFVFGDDEAHRRCAEAARAVFAEARTAWVGGASGVDLYALAETAAQRHGCTLVREMAGHRVSDFPTRSTAGTSWRRPASRRGRVSGCWRSRSAIRCGRSAPSSRTCSCVSRTRADPPPSASSPATSADTACSRSRSSSRRAW